MIPLFGVLIEHQVTAHDVGVVTGKLCFDKGLCNVLPVFCNEHQAGHRCTDIFCDFKIVGEHSVAEQLTADPVWCVAGNIQQIVFGKVVLVSSLAVDWPFGVGLRLYESKMPVISE